MHKHISLFLFFGRSVVSLSSIIYYFTIFAHIFFCFFHHYKLKKIGSGGWHAINVQCTLHAHMQMVMEKNGMYAKEIKPVIQIKMNERA